jgi:hypothetical protein
VCIPAQCAVAGDADRGTMSSSEASMKSKVNAKLTEFRVIWEKHRLTDKAIVLARVVSRTAATRYSIPLVPPWWRSTHSRRD